MQKRELSAHSLFEIQPISCLKFNKDKRSQLSF